MRSHRQIFLLLLLGGSLLLLGCGDDASSQTSTSEDDDLTPADDDAADDDNDLDDDDTIMRFPDSFLFGVATAGYQIDMGCPTLPIDECADPRSDWYHFATSPETVNSPLTFLSGEDPALTGPGHWELFAEDFDLATQELGLGGFRMSIEWSRIFPNPTFGINGYQNLKAVADPQAIDHYHAVFRALRARGLTPLVNLNHYTLPDWIHDAVGCHLDFNHCSPRGWFDREPTVGEIAKFAGFIAQEFGAEVDLWATLNEPLALAIPGYLLPTPTRTNPPVVLLHADAFKTVMTAMIEGHARMVDAIRAHDLSDADGDGLPALIGLVYAMSPVVPNDPENEVDRRAAENLFYLWNMAFLRAVALGELDEDLDGESVYRPDLAGRLDFLGLNYYTRITVEGLPFSILPFFSPLLTINPLTVAFNEIYPRGIYEMAAVIVEDLGVPVYVTENNARSDPNDNPAREKQSLVEHLSWLWYAVEQGLDIRGYFYWSLTDFIEWNQGVKPWGLFAVDPLTKARSPRALVAVYRQITDAHGIPPELAAQFPVDFD